MKTVTVIFRAKKMVGPLPLLPRTFEPLLFARRSLRERGIVVKFSRDLAVQDCDAVVVHSRIADRGKAQAIEMLENLRM